MGNDRLRLAVTLLGLAALFGLGYLVGGWLFGLVR